MLAPVVHERQSEVRLASYADLFGGEPVQVFPYSDFSRPDDDIRVEVLVYPLAECVALVTSGLSDHRCPRRELLQYCRHGRRADAHRLHAAAYTALDGGRWLDFGSAITLPYPSGSAWPHTVFLPPPVQEHSDFEIAVGGDPTRLLWHVPLSDSEFDYQREHGIASLLRGMSSACVPWVFDEARRPVLR